MSTPPYPPPDEWGAVSKLFHWSTLILILAMIALGWIAVGYSMSPTKIHLFIWHKSLGLFVLAWTALRLAWRLTHRGPALPPDMPRLERWAAHASHTVLYLLLIAMPFSGWVINSAADFPLKWFGLFRVPDITAPDEHLQKIAESVHWALLWILITIVVIHAGAALRHHFLRRDDVLRRMLPGGSGK